VLQNGQVLFGRLQSIELQPQQESMVFFELSFQGWPQFVNLLAQTSFGQLGHFLRGRFAFHQSFEHQPAGDSENIGGHGWPT